MLNITAKKASANDIKTDLLIVGLREKEKLSRLLKNLDKQLEGLISEVVLSKDFKGKTKESLLLIPPKRTSSYKIALIGLGEQNNYSLEQLRLAISQTAPIISKHQIRNIEILLETFLPKKTSAEDAAQLIIETLNLSLYKFAEYKKQEQETVALEKVQFALRQGWERQSVLRGATRGQAIAEAVNYTRDLANHPGNVMTPATLANEAKKLAKQFKIPHRILEKSEMKKLGMGALLGVNQGSSLPPKFIILEYNRQKTGAPIVLVGKGITFDSGGISIKPSAKLDEMKYDMAGAATVLGIIKAAAMLKSPQKLVALIPATENLPSGTAMRPGDIVKTMSGKTIEVANTDAEGRMILADALCYAAKYKPRLVIDYATLTGAAEVALGTEYSAVFATDEKILSKLRLAAEKSGEKIWPLPLAPEYHEKIKSEVADINNIGKIKGAGVITAALFLQEFVSFPWVHLDIAATAWTTEPKPYNPVGATGVGVRLTTEFLK